jgi:hypothetical protein
MEENQKYWLMIIAGILLIGSGILYQLNDSADQMVSMIAISGGTVFIVVSVLRYNRYGAGIVQDERTRKIGAKALSYSWLLTFILINGLFWIDYLNIFDIGLRASLGLILFAMTISGAGLQYLMKRGVLGENED